LRAELQKSNELPEWTGAIGDLPNRALFPAAGLSSFRASDFGLLSDFGDSDFGLRVNPAYDLTYLFNRFTRSQSLTGQKFSVIFRRSLVGGVLVSTWKMR